MDLTENKVAEIATDELLKKAKTIRDAVVAKSVTASQVGTLFCELIEACGNIRDALALFLDTNVDEILSGIDNRLSDADAAATAANAAAQRAEATRTLVTDLISSLTAQGAYRPAVLEVDECSEVTIRNTTGRQISARILPDYAVGGVLFISDNKALEITPDGIITPVAVGVSKVTVVATGNTSLYGQLLIAVVNPRIRLTTAGTMRFDSNGYIRLT